MTRLANGSFDVKMTPQSPDDAAPAVGRMTLDKKFHGDLDGPSLGLMLAYMGSVKDSAGYVAIEQFSGVLHGRKGGFVLQHSGLMTRGTQQLSITVVPDSGTDELSGISGKMTIQVIDGKHSYELEYSLTPGS